MTITVVVCAYNEAVLLPGCLYSLLSQTRPRRDPGHQQCVRHLTGIADVTAVDDELEERCARRTDPVRLPSVGLLQAILQNHLRIRGVVSEIDDRLYSLRWSDAEALDVSDRMLEEMIVGGDDVIEGQTAAEEEFVQARARAVQETEAVLAPLHVEEGLDRAVHEELVAQEAVVIEVVVDKEAVPVELSVLEDERDVELSDRTRCPSRSATPVSMLEASIVTATVAFEKSPSGTCTVPDQRANVPRTFAITRCRTEKCTLETVGVRTLRTRPRLILRARRRIAPDSSKPPTAARCSLMKSAMSRRPCRRARAGCRPSAG
jgi:hypothetical protein